MNLDNLNEQPFEKIKADAESFYKQIKIAWCPALKSQINFTSDGFHHLRYDNNRSERSKEEQKNKLIYLKEALKIVKTTATIQEFRVSLQSIGKIRQDGFKKTSKVEYYAFLAITNLEKGKRFRVVVRRIGDGPFHFWSLMPVWSQLPIANNQTIRIIGSKQIEDE